MQPLNLAFVGGSINSAVGYTHFVSSAMDGRWQLVAGCFCTDPQVNLETAQVYGVSPERLYATLQELLDKEKSRLDAVVILTPTPAHFENVMACMRAGVPVICEKSLATNRAQAEAMLALRDELRAFLAVTYNYTGYPMLRELAEGSEALPKLPTSAFSRESIYEEHL